MIEVPTLILTITLMSATMALDRCECPEPGWSVDGVRPSGATTCSPPPPRDCGEPKGPHTQPCPPDSRSAPMLVICTGGTRAIVVNQRVIGCQR